MMGTRVNRRVPVVDVVNMPVFRVVDGHYCHPADTGHDRFGNSRARPGNYERHHPTPNINIFNRYKKNLHFRPKRPGERAESCGRHVSAKCVASVKQAFGDCA